MYATQIRRGIRYTKHVANRLFPFNRILVEWNRPIGLPDKHENIR